MTENEIEKLAVEYAVKVDEMEEFCNKTSENFANISNSEKEWSDMSLVSGITKVVKRLGEYMSDVKDIMGEVTKFIAYNVGQYLLKRLEILYLKMKKIMLKFKKWVAEFKKRIILMFTSLAESDTMGSIAAAIMGFLSVLSAAIAAILEGLEVMLNMIPPILSVEAKTMVLFMTPKSMIKQDMIAKNPNLSITDKMPDFVKEQISKLYFMAVEANNKVKNAIMATLTAGAEKILKDDSLAEKIESANMTDAVEMGVMKAVEALIDLTIFPEALPKFEKLNITNPSFLAWLVTSFEPAAQRSFGIPGF